MDRPTISSEDILIRVQSTPNPYALKFVCNMAFKVQGKATFNSPYECQSIPLAKDLFFIPGVKQVHLFQNTLTVTHDGSLTNELLGEQVEVVIRTRMPIHDAVFATEDELQQKTKVDRSTLSPEMLQIEEILDRTIRPGLQADGGDMDLISFENNIVKILYQGACGGCPSAMMGTLDAIQGILQQELDNPDIKVRPI